MSIMPNLPFILKHHVEGSVPAGICNAGLHVEALCTGDNLCARLKPVSYGPIASRGHTKPARLHFWVEYFGLVTVWSNSSLAQEEVHVKLGSLERTLDRSGLVVGLSHG